MIPLLFDLTTHFFHAALTGIHYTPGRAEPHATVSHISHAPVLSGPQVHHPASEVGLLVHQPVAVHHIAGLAVGHSVAVLDVVAVLHQLVTLALEVLSLKHPHPVGASVLLVKAQKKTSQHRTLRIEMAILLLLTLLKLQCAVLLVIVFTAFLNRYSLSNLHFYSTAENKSSTTEKRFDYFESILDILLDILDTEVTQMWVPIYNHVYLFKVFAYRGN